MLHRFVSFIVVVVTMLASAGVAFARPAAPFAGVALHSSGFAAGPALAGWRSIGVRLALTGHPGVLVLDVDETVLDNAPCEADVCLLYAARRPDFADAAWSAWCRRGSAASVPGAVPAVRAAVAAGWRVVWVTGRRAPLAVPTAANLWAVGLPCDPFGGLFCVGSSKNKPAVFAELLASARAAGLPVVFAGDQATDAPLLPIRANADHPAVPVSVWAGFGWSSFTGLPNWMY